MHAYHNQRVTLWYHIFVVVAISTLLSLLNNETTCLHELCIEAG